VAVARDVCNPRRTAAGALAAMPAALVQLWFCANASARLETHEALAALYF
jgi:hypothetical protein